MIQVAVPDLMEAARLGMTSMQHCKDAELKRKVHRRTILSDWAGSKAYCNHGTFGWRQIASLQAPVPAVFAERHIFYLAMTIFRVALKSAARSW